MVLPGKGSSVSTNRALELGDSWSSSLTAAGDRGEYTGDKRGDSADCEDLGEYTGDMRESCEDEGLGDLAGTKLGDLVGGDQTGESRGNPAGDS